MPAEQCPLCEAKLRLAMGLYSSVWLCESDERHYLSLTEWSEWVRGERSTAQVMALLASRSRCEPCVVCGLPTPYMPSTPISERFGYVEGVGQLCSVCCNAEA